MRRAEPLQSWYKVAVSHYQQKGDGNESDRNRWRHRRHVRGAGAGEKRISDRGLRGGQRIKPVGAAISIWPNGVKCLNYLGLGEQLRALGGNMTMMAYHDFRRGEVLTRFSMQPLVESVGERPYPVARADLQAMLLNRYGAQRVHFGKRVSHIEQDASGVTARFTDGSDARGDFLIAADGTHSVIRARSPATAPNGAMRAT